ncbi:Ankyrin repeat protein [Oopsacas minuta]|uniref:Ankyrin repeat protein n=1 Tax=Oopsacas minuta TaxID=111878 RepID=A0AAV7K191_9METZ|nr:Ankyrin repeat protein [Oopsacas minuta]
MVETIELISGQNYDQNTTYSRHSSRNETDVAYREIDGLNYRIGREEGSQSNIMVVPELEEALLTNNMTLLKRLMQEGAPYLYEAYNNNKPLEMSAFYCRSDIIKIILDRDQTEGSNDEKQIFNDHTGLALYRACISNSKETAKMLISAGAPIIPTVHPHVAAQHGSWSVLDVILRHNKLNINEIDQYYLTPLHYAAKRGYAPTVGYLLAQGADPNIQSDIGKSALHLACESAGQDVIYLLVTNNADIDLIDIQGYTALLIAAENGKDNTISILANAGANLDVRNEQGRSALILAAINDHANVIHELITNGASIDITDNGRYNALERGLMNRKDSATSMLIRLTPETDFLLYYTEDIEINVNKLIKFGMEKSIQALLDRMVIIDDKYHCIIMTKYLDVDVHNKTPADCGYKKNSLYLLQRIAELASEQVAYHGVIRLLVDHKMRRFGYYILLIKLVSYLLFLLALSFSLIHAAHETNPMETYWKDFGHLRIISETFVLLYFLVNILTELAEFTRIVISTFRRLKDKRINTQTEIARELAVSQMYYTEGIVHQRDNINSRFVSSVANCFLVRVIRDYLKERSNYLDLLSLFSLAILIPLRTTSQPVQWVFATCTFLFNSLRLFNYISIIPIIGPYSNIFYKIITKDVPKFAFMFLIILFIYTGSFYIALRSPFTLQGLLNKSYSERTSTEKSFNDDVIWILYSGFRVLPESNVLEQNYLYNNLNWLAAGIYVTFLFLTVVVFLNVFIAQLSDRYAKVRQNAERTFAWHRLNFIVQIQKSSLLSLCIDFRKKLFIEGISINSDKFMEYFGANMMRYHAIALEQDIDEKGLLGQIKHHVRLATKTRDLSQTMQLMKKHD